MRHVPCLLICAALLTAGDDPWKSKPVANWTPEDAKQVLSKSGWVKMAAVSVAPQRSEPQVRDGGRIGGVGIHPKRQAAPEPPGSAPSTLRVRWESALPVRTAALLTNETGTPEWDGDYYAIAVYGVPGTTQNPKTLAGELKRAASLKRDGKKDLKPERVDVIQSEGRLTTLVYFFPRSGEITPSDQRVTFEAQIGQMLLGPIFELEDMRVLGKLEL
jgi:hypothetical protein